MAYFFQHISMSCVFFYGNTALFVSDPVRNLKDRFSKDKAHMKKSGKLMYIVSVEQISFKGPF